MAVDPVSLGITAALTAAQMAMTAMQTIEGPRIKDNSATMADYGAAMNYLVGTQIVSCPCIFAKPIEEKRKKRKGKAGKQVSYTGFGTWAVHIADHELTSILKIWFDNQLVYDRSGGTERVYPLAADYELDTSLRFYTGTEDQMPDPDMEAFIEARDGPGTCPAYRGEAYAYFDRVPLEKLGQRFPDVKMLVSSGFSPLDIFWEMTGAPFSGESHTVSSISPASTQVQYFQPGDGQTHTITMRVYGDVELRTYTGTTPVSGPVVRGGTPGADAHYNIYKLEVSDPPATYFFNHGAQGLALTSIDETFEIEVADGATLTYVADPLDGYMIDAYQSLRLVGSGGYSVSNIQTLLELIADKGGADPEAYDFSAATQVIPGFKWTQATGVQICEALCDLFDTDLRPHDFKLVAFPRGGASGGTLEAGEFVAANPLYNPTLPSPTSLPQKVALTFTDSGADYNPNTASPPGPDPAAANSAREMTIDMSTLVLNAGSAQGLATRRLRRERIGATQAGFALTRQQLALEPADVRVIDFDGHQMRMRATKTVLGADGRIVTEWSRDLANIAVLPEVEGALAAGSVSSTITEPADTVGEVLDIALVDDAHEQSAPFAYVVAGPDAPGSWMGADFSVSDTGELDSYADGWASIASGDGTIIGELAGELPDALPWVPDMGSSFSVVLNFGELTSATLEDLLVDDGLNLCAIRSGDGWELVQFMTATLTAPQTYAVSGLLRGVRGTEWSTAGHAAGDTFVLLDTLTIKTLGAAEVGDTDYYIATGTGHTPDQTAAFPIAFTGAAHKPYSPVFGTQEASGADLVFDAVRRTRIGGSALNGQDVPLGQASESWALDILDGLDVARTITGTSLPITYLEADQITDFGSAQPGVDARLYQLDPTLNLRGYPLAFAA